jgi:ammonium transporter Rh
MQHKSIFTPNHFAHAALLFQAAIVLLFSFCVTWHADIAPSATPGAQVGIRYAMFTDVHVMMSIGFGFLYTLLRRYAWTGVSYNFLLCASVLQWAFLAQGFWENVRHRVSGALAPGSFPAIPLDLDRMIDADYTVATVLISFGAVLGRLSAAQALHMAFWEALFATANVSIQRHLGVADAGGSMVIHVFGAAFGLAFALALGDRALAGEGNGEAKLSTSRHNGTFAMIGTLFLFCFWPSFNGALLAEGAQQRAALATLLSISASVVVAFAASKAVHGGARFDMEHVQNATLAGGVAIGACCDMLANPGGAVAVGAVAGLVSVYGFSFASPWLKARGLTDTCGIFNLHFLPGLLGGVASAVAMGSLDAGQWPDAARNAHFKGHAGRSPLTAGCWQMAVCAISLGFGGAAGALTALLVKRGPAFEPLTNFYEDAEEWNTPVRSRGATRRPRQPRPCRLGLTPPPSPLSHTHAHSPRAGK